MGIVKSSIFVTHLWDTSDCCCVRNKKARCQAWAGHDYAHCLFCGKRDTGSDLVGCHVTVDGSPNRYLVVGCKSCNSPGNHIKFGARMLVPAEDVVPFFECHCGQSFASSVSQRVWSGQKP